MSSLISVRMRSQTDLTYLDSFHLSALGSGKLTHLGTKGAT